jgi:hypothetical protein
MPRLATAYQNQAKQRRLRRVKSTTTIRHQEISQSAFLFGFRNSTPVALIPRQPDMRVHLLLWFNKIRPPKICPQNGVATDYGSPSLPQGNVVDCLV